MLVFALLACAFRLVTRIKPSAAVRDAFSIFEWCRDVELIRLQSSPLGDATAVHVELCLADGGMLRTRGVALTRERALHVASASSLYALSMYRSGRGQQDDDAPISNSSSFRRSGAP